MFFLALTIFIASLVLNFPFPHEGPYGEAIASALNLPIRSARGIHYVGIISFALLLISLYLFTRSVKKHSGRVVLLAFVIAFFVPPMAVNAFQKTFAADIYAVSYERNKSKCQFEMTDETTLLGKCELPFENYSNKDVQFTIELYDRYPHHREISMVSLMNNDAPYVVTLKGNERKTVKIESAIDVSTIENYARSGSASGVSIVMKSGSKTRKL